MFSKRFLVTVLSAGVVGGAACAQNAPPPPPASAPTPAAPRAAELKPGGQQGELKLRNVCKQLNLTPQQEPQVETLIQVFQAELEDYRRSPEKLIAEIQQKYGELKDAKTANDEARIKQLKDELRNLAPTVRAEGHFYEGLMPILNDAQKARLEQIRRMELAGLALKPVQVLKAAKECKLTPEQERQVESINRDFRSRVANNPQQNVDEYIASLRGVMTNSQAQDFDRIIDEYRRGELTSSTTKPAAASAPAPAPAPAPASPEPKKP